MSIFIVCKDGNKTYRSGEKFVKDDCSANCTCMHVGAFFGRRRRSTSEEIGNVGYSKCSPLCDASLSRTQCPVGHTVKKYQSEVATNCYCNRSMCVERK